MDQEIVNSLRQAANDIKEGKLKTARTLLVELLRDNPEVDQAWYMLSFTVRVLERQIYALEQALKVNPGNEKALTRLQKLRGESPPPKDAFSYKTSKRDRAESASKPEDAYPREEASSADLLSRRLLGGEEAEPVPAPVQQAEEPPTEQVLPQPAEEDAPPKPTRKERRAAKKAEKAEKYNKKVFGVRRGTFMLLMLILIFSGIWLLYNSQQVKGLVAGLFGGRGGTAAENDSAAVLPTETPTVTPGFSLPAVWTATPTELATPTEAPEDVSLDLSGVIIDFSALEAPSTEAHSDFETIRQQLSAMMEDAEIPALDGYLVSDSELQDSLAEFSRLSQYREQSAAIGSFFSGLGMANNSTQTNSLLQNMWADPNGTLLFFDSNQVILKDYDGNQYQRYSFAQALAQGYRNAKDSFSEIGIFPICSPIDESCEVLYALTKGEAAYFAGLWAEEYMSSTAYNGFSNTEVNRFTVPANQPPAFMDFELSLPDDYGQAFVEGIFQEGGLAAVDDLYRNLPTTTEQLMHPEKYLSGEDAVQIQPTLVADLLGVSWQEVYQGSLGQWKTYLLMTAPEDINTRMDEESSWAAASGWGGDHAQIYFRNSTQEYVVVVEWAWDAPAEASEFLNYFSIALSLRSDSTGENLSAGGACYSSQQGVDCLIPVGGNVIWLHAPNQDVMDQLMSAFS